MEVPGSKPGGVKTSKNFRIFPEACGLRNGFFSRILNGEERRPTSCALIITTKNETTGPALNGLSRQCECSQQNGRHNFGASSCELCRTKVEEYMFWPVVLKPVEIPLFTYNFVETNFVEVGSLFFERLTEAHACRVSFQRT